jgi:AraC family transcriptional regulator
MLRVTEYIDAALDTPLDLNALASIAHFSPFHFHRLFSAYMGEPLGAYIRRRRLEIAATRLLAQPKIPVTQIALAVGFGSTEAFAHAFKARFGLAPTAWRAQERALRQANSKPDQVERKRNQAQPASDNHNDAVSQSPMESGMKVEIVERKPTPIVFLRRVGPYGPPLSEFWQTEVYPWMAQSGLLQQPRYGISHDDPNVVAPQKCRYDAGVEMPENFKNFGKALRSTLAGGSYAAMSFKGTVEQFEPAWTSMLRDWLPASGFQLDARPMFEYYPQGTNYDPATGVFDCKLCVPVVPL